MQRRSTGPAMVMALFKYSWFQRFVIELTPWGAGEYSTAHVWMPNREALKPSRNRHLSLTFTFYSWLKDHYKSAPSAGRLPLGTEEISFIYSCLWPGSLLRQEDAAKIQNTYESRQAKLEQQLQHKRGVCKLSGPAFAFISWSAYTNMLVLLPTD